MVLLRLVIVDYSTCYELLLGNTHNNPPGLRRQPNRTTLSFSVDARMLRRLKWTGDGRGCLFGGYARHCAGCCIDLADAEHF